MDAGEPRVRRRGFFLHSPDSAEPDTGELENPEGFVVRVRFGRSNALPRHGFSGGRHAGTEADSRSGTHSVSEPAIRSGSVTGSRQRAHLPR